LGEEGGASLEKKYIKTYLEEMIVINKIITIHYFEFASNYVFQGEKHDFWEFLYVDKGEVEIMADTKGYKLHQGDIVLHKPNEFHSVWANGVIAPNIVVVSFECNSAAMKFFEGKILKLSSMNKNILGEIVREGKAAFENNLGKVYNSLVKKEEGDFASQQLIKLYLEMLLIKIIRENEAIKKEDRISSATKERMENDIVSNIIEFFNENIDKNYSFNDICVKFSLGKTHLKTLFKDSTNQGAMLYFRMLKIEEAKKLIREGKYNFTEIAQRLGYESVHYFSRSFKKCTNMTPSEYDASVKSIAQV
jgi:AraC-like DNA-binding protein/quercetin dioxygenase-like cupin family protein